MPLSARPCLQVDASRGYPRGLSAVEVSVRALLAVEISSMLIWQAEQRYHLPHSESP